MKIFNSVKNYFINNPTQYKAEFLLLFCALIWGFSFPSVKIALNYASPNAFIFFRFVITLAIFYLILHKKISKFKRNEVVNGFILGIYLFVGFLSQTLGMVYTTASNSAFITGANLILIPFTQVLVVKIKPKVENVIGIIIVMFGIYILSGMHTSDLNIGDLITFICAIAFSIHIVYLDKYSRKNSALALIYGQYIAMTIFSFISMIIIEVIWLRNFKFQLEPYLIFSISFNGLFSTFLAFFIAMKFQKYTTPVRASLIYNLEQVFAVIFSYFIINEILVKHQIIGAVIILSGLLFSEFYSEIRKYILQKGIIK